MLDYAIPDRIGFILWQILRLQMFFYSIGCTGTKYQRYPRVTWLTDSILNNRLPADISIVIIILIKNILGHVDNIGCILVFKKCNIGQRQIW